MSSNRLSCVFANSRKFEIFLMSAALNRFKGFVKSKCWRVFVGAGGFWCLFECGTRCWLVLVDVQ